MNSIFNYNNANITFKASSGEVFVNATQMAKGFGTKPDNWLRTEPAQKMIDAIAVSHICDTADLVRVVQGGNLKAEQGTWMHEDIALVFAQWLSPQFYVWCNTHIKQLLQTGYTSTLTNEQMLMHLAKEGILQVVTTPQIAQTTQATNPRLYQDAKTREYDNLADWQWNGYKNAEIIYNHFLQLIVKQGNQYQGVTLNDGEIMASIRTIAEATGVSTSTVRHILEKFIASGEIRVATTSRYTKVTVVGYRLYKVKN